MPIEFPERFNMADHFLYHNLEEGRENKVCLYFKDRTYTYGEAARLSNRAGNALRSVGVEMEDRVLIALPDCPEFVWTWFGASRAGGVITMVNPLLPADDYRYYLEYTRARVAVRSEEHTSELQSRSDLVCRLLLEKKKDWTSRLVWAEDQGALRLRACRRDAGRLAHHRCACCV